MGNFWLCYDHFGSSYYRRENWRNHWIPKKCTVLALLFLCSGHSLPQKLLERVSHFDERLCKPLVLPLFLLRRWLFGDKFSRTRSCCCFWRMGKYRRSFCYYRTNYWRLFNDISLVEMVIAHQYYHRDHCPVGNHFHTRIGKNEKSRFDILGALLSGVGLLPLSLALLKDNDTVDHSHVQSVSWWSFCSLYSRSLFLFSLILLTIFAFLRINVVAQKRNSSFQMTLFQNKTFSIGLALLGTLTMGMLGMIFVLPILLENVFHLNAIQTGMVLMPMSLLYFCLGFLLLFSPHDSV